MTTKTQKILFLLLSIFLVSQVFSAQLVYKKLIINKPTDLSNIENYVAKILVEEPNFLVVRIEENKVIPGVLLVPVTEKDFIQRKVRIYFENKQQLKQILETGMDIFAKDNEKIIGRAFDAQIKQLETLGIIVHKL